MLNKCLNPACDARFRYLHEGRVFSIDLVTPSFDVELPPAHRQECFWLCPKCVRVLKVVVENGVVVTRPLAGAHAAGENEETLPPMALA
jgi:hypothetical protein